MHVLWWTLRAITAQFVKDMSHPSINRQHISPLDVAALPCAIRSTYDKKYISRKPPTIKQNKKSEREIHMNHASQSHSVSCCFHVAHQNTRTPFPQHAS